MHRRTLVMAILMALFISLMTVPASAHYIKQVDWLFKSDNALCVKGGAEVSHGQSKAGYFWSRVESHRNTLDWTGLNKPCGQKYNAPVDHLKTRLRVMVDFSSDGKGWLQCGDFDWLRHNRSSGYAMSIYYDRSASTGPCGRNYYNTLSHDYAKWSNGNWYGGRLWADPGTRYGSGHWLPTS
jgi:hypothetical protein